MLTTNFSLIIKRITLSLVISTVLILTGSTLYGLQPFTVSEWLVRLSNQWMVTELWRASSINVLRAGSHDVVAPVPWIACWIGMAYVIHLFLCRFSVKEQQSIRLHSLLILCVIGWILLDAHWQWQLEYTRSLAKQRYENKSLEGKRLSADDGDFYAQLMEIKRYLPTQPTRMMVATPDNTPLERYLRLRTRYHLLPHNVLLHVGLDNFSGSHKRSSNYLLVITPIPNESLSSLSLLKVIEVPLATLYRWQ